MYVTRPLSMYLNEPSALSLSPPDEGPNSGILVIQDQEKKERCCLGLFSSESVRNLPFPQNKKLWVQIGDIGYPVVFIPVLDQPLSSNRYYIIQPYGKHRGQAYNSSSEEDRTTYCCYSYGPDLKPKPLNPHDINQQFEIKSHRSHGFVGESVIPDGKPPHFLRVRGWRLLCSSTRNFYIQDDAPGLDSTLRARLPPIGSSSPVVVGKWYCPFMFIKESNLEDQVKHSMFYKMTLEQKWEPIYTSEYDDNNNVVVVDTVVDTERAVVIGGVEVKSYETNVVDGVMWFKSLKDKREVVVGLSLEIFERMKWEEERVGWVGGQKEVRVIKEEKYEGVEGWSKYGCYVLVERFVLRKNDESLVMIYEFKHTHQIKDKWE